LAVNKKLKIVVRRLDVITFVGGGRFAFEKLKCVVLRKTAQNTEGVKPL
jgi:hypothetical protein